LETELEKMSYLLVVIIGAVVGFVAGQYIKGNEHGVAVDLIGGGVGACVAVLISRMMMTSAAGTIMSVIVTIIGAVLTLFIARQVLKAKAVPVPRTGRRF
jgi:uncharacterized membrane protein YeaQ/YmgE (transglycosylase-associated protein family)